MPIIDIRDKYVSYKFEIYGKYSLIKGDSATGKTTLCKLIDDYRRGAKNIINNSSHIIRTLPTEYKDFKSESYKDAVIFIDEESAILQEHGYEAWLKTIDAYFVFITRDLCLRNLPISVDSVYTMHSSGRFHYLEHIDSRFTNQSLCGADLILTEDSNSGKEFVAEVIKYADCKGVALKSAGGKDNLVTQLREAIKCGLSNFVIFYDAAGFGVSVIDLKQVIEDNTGVNAFIVDWESFENYILGSPALNLSITLKDIGCTSESLEDYSELEMRKNFRYNKSNLIHCLKINGCKKCVSRCSHPIFDFKKYIYWRVETLYKFLKVNSSNVGISYVRYVQLTTNYSRNIEHTMCSRITQVNHAGQWCCLTHNGIMKQFEICDIVLSAMSGKVFLSNPSELQDWCGFIRD